MKGFYEKKHTFQNNDTSTNNILPVTSIISLLGSIAGDHSASLGQTPSWLKEKEISWVLLDWHLKLYSTPKINGTYNIKTWSNTYKRLQSHRSFTINNQEGDLIAECMSKWVIINYSSRKLVKPSSEIILAYECDIDDVFVENTFSQAPPTMDVPVFSEKLTTTKEHIDTNNHVNNNVYIKWHQAYINSSNAKSDILVDLKAHYQKELYLGDAILHNVFLNKNEDGSLTYISQFSLENNSDYINCQISSTWTC